jgi:DNA repair ATPase RecN
VRVTKTATKGQTRVAIELLADAERAGELARMLGGAKPSAEAVAHAVEMLKRARARDRAMSAKSPEKLL